MKRKRRPDVDPTTKRIRLLLENFGMLNCWQALLPQSWPDGIRLRMDMHLNDLAPLIESIMENGHYRTFDIRQGYVTAMMERGDVQIELLLNPGQSFRSLRQLGVGEGWIPVILKAQDDLLKMKVKSLKNKRGTKWTRKTSGSRT